MNNKLSILLSIFIFAGSANCGFNIKDVDFYITKMTIEEKTGQMFMIGGIGPDKLINPELYQKYHFGNVFLGSADLKNLSLEQISKLTKKLQNIANKYNKIPLLISTDQEGGKVNRLQKGFKVAPSQFEVGEKYNIEQAEQLAANTAGQMSVLGINVNFSPVVDVNTNNKSHVALSSRVFSSDPEKVARYGIAYQKGYAKYNVIGTLKHFPGYGNVSPDPHKHLPVSNKTYDELAKCEFLPYIESIKAGVVDMIMTAHIGLPKIDNDEIIPATYSKNVIFGILRQKIGYNGVIVTDDLNMGGAIEKNQNSSQLAIKTINSGVDLLLFVGFEQKQINIYNSIVKAVKNGKIPVSRIDESVKRILLLKLKYRLK